MDSRLVACGRVVILDITRCEYKIDHSNPDEYFSQVEITVAYIRL